MTKSKYRVTYDNGDTWKVASITEDKDFALYVEGLCKKGGASRTRVEEITEIKE